MDHYTQRQQRFIDVYVQTLNAAEAARQAGYSAHTAREQGCRLLASPYIRSEVER